jgi:SAM-dependent methyltransferase
MKRLIIKIHWILSMQFGIDPVKLFKSLYSLPKFLLHYIKFRLKYRGKIEMKPCLNDWFEEGGTANSEYFLQDLLVARLISDSNPKKHVDIGSRVDGFVSSVASFRQIEVLDIRPISAKIPGITFKQVDLMNLGSSFGSDIYCDSLSCLHTIEHFGLGRYGDPIDVNGFEKGISNMSRLVKPAGTFYLSTPVGLERVEFNANRVFNPNTIIDIAFKNNLTLFDFIQITQKGKINKFLPSKSQLLEISKDHYSLGIFIFKKNKFL